MSVSSGVTKLSVAQINDLITKFNSDAADRGITTRIPNISGESSSQEIQARGKNPEIRSA